MIKLGMRVRFNEGERVKIVLGDHSNRFGWVAPAPEGERYNWKKEVFIRLDAGSIVKKFKNEVCKV